MNKLQIGIRRKTDDKYGIKGWWVEQATEQLLYIKDADDRISPGIPKFTPETPDGHVRAIWIYTGKEKHDEKPSEIEVKQLIKKYSGKWGIREGEK